MAETIAIGAVHKDKVITEISSRGAAVDIAAPGENILSTCAGGQYVRLSGTSMATPFALFVAVQSRGSMQHGCSRMNGPWRRRALVGYNAGTKASFRRLPSLPMAAVRPPSCRIESLDQFRGYTVAGMFRVNFLGSFAVTPPLLRHHNTFCSYADTIMPQFFCTLPLPRCGFSRRFAPAPSSACCT